MKKTIWLAACLVLGTTFGCESDCSVNETTEGIPFNSLECGAGQLCYLGSCLDSCRAGLELSEPCVTNDDCGGARPFCNGRTCSACAPGFECVAGLDLCRPVSDIPFVEEPEPTTEASLVPPGPLDASLPDRGLARFPEDDEGDVRTRLGLAVTVRLARETILDQGAPRDTPVVFVEAWDVSDALTFTATVWRPEYEPPRLQTLALEATGDGPTPIQDLNCELRELTTPTVAVSRTDLGRIDITWNEPTAEEREDFAGEDLPELFSDFRARFDPVLGYVVNPDPSNTSLVPPSLFAPSIQLLDPQGEITVGGTGLAGVVDTSGFSAVQRLPFRFVLDPRGETYRNMEQGFRLDASAALAEDLVFQWLEPVENGTVAGEEVFLQIDGSSALRPHELLCRSPEGPDRDPFFRVRASLLQAFRDRMGQTGIDLPVRLGRRNRQGLSIPSANPNLGIQATSVVSQHFRSTLRFE